MIHFSTPKLLIGTCCLTLLLASCAVSVPVITPELDQQMSAILLDGKAVLDCQLQCSGSWGARRQAFSQMNAAHDWHDLGVGVMQVGYQGDLAYFYLGRAAQGLGADEAAIRYYQTSAAIALAPSRQGQCRGTYDTCDGIAMPYILVTLIQQAEADLAKRQAVAAAPVPDTTPQPPIQSAKLRAKQTAKPAPQKPSDIELIEPPPVTR